MKRVKLYFLGLFILCIGLIIVVNTRVNFIKASEDIVSPIQESNYSYSGRNIRKIEFYSDLESGINSHFNIMEFDESGFITSVRDDVFSAIECINVYNENGLVIKQYSKTGGEEEFLSWECEYDDNNNPIKEISYSSGNVFEIRGYEYNNANQVVSRNVEYRNSMNNNFLNVYAYNEEGNLIEDCCEDNCITSYAYDEVGFIEVQHVEFVDYPEHNREFRYYRDEYMKEIIAYDDGNPYVMEEWYYDNNDNMNWISPVDYYTNGTTFYSNTSCANEPHCIRKIIYDSNGNIIYTYDYDVWFLNKDNSRMEILCVEGKISQIYRVEYYE